MMIAEEYLTRSRLFRRLRNGRALRLAACQDGLNCRGTWRSLSLVGDLLSWLTRRYMPEGSGRAKSRPIVRLAYSLFPCRLRSRMPGPASPFSSMKSAAALAAIA